MTLLEALGLPGALGNPLAPPRTSKGTSGFTKWLHEPNPGQLENPRALLEEPQVGDSGPLRVVAITGS